MSEVIFDQSDQDVKESSRETLQHKQESGQLNNQEEMVRDALKRIDYFPTRNELKHEELPDWEKSTISGRVNALKEKGVVTVLGKREDQYANHNISVEVIALTEEIE